MIRKEFPGVYYFKESNRWISGLPDLIICAWGIFCAMEIKTIKGKATPLQEYVLKTIRAAGGVAGLARNVEDARQMILEARTKANANR
jgi:hypothetical protein